MGKNAFCCVVVGCSAQALAVFYQAEGTRAFLDQDANGACAICDDNDDEPDLSLVAKVTAKFQTAALLGQVYDSSVFVGTIYERVLAIDEYIDYPERVSGLAYGDSILYLGRALPPEQRAAEWTAILGVGRDSSALAEVIRRRDDYIFAEDFHVAVLEGLGLPSGLAGVTYRELERYFNSEAEARKVLIHASG